MTEERKHHNKEETPAEPVPEPEERPFRYSLFSKLAWEVSNNHLDQLRSSQDFDVLIFMLYTYVLNISKDANTINALIDNIKDNLTESDLQRMHENRSATLAKVTKYIINSLGREDLKEYQQMVQNVYLSKHHKRPVRHEGGDGLTISRENIFVRDAL